MTHTPGPWVVGYGYADCIMVEQVTKEDFEPIAMIEFDELGTTPTLTQEANARLIAAAPELLEALRDLERFVSESVTTASDLHEVRLARKALAQATAERIEEEPDA